MGVGEGTEAAASSFWKAPRLQVGEGRRRAGSPQDYKKEENVLFLLGVLPPPGSPPFLPRQLGTDLGKRCPLCLSPESWWGAGCLKTFP